MAFSMCAATPSTPRSARRRGSKLDEEEAPPRPALALRGLHAYAPQQLLCTPQAYNLAHIESFGVWAEGVEGEFKLEVKQIAAGP